MEPKKKLLATGIVALAFFSIGLVLHVMSITMRENIVVIICVSMPLFTIGFVALIMLRIYIHYLERVDSRDETHGQEV